MSGLLLVAAQQAKNKQRHKNSNELKRMGTNSTNSSSSKSNYSNSSSNLTSHYSSKEYMKEKHEPKYDNKPSFETQIQSKFDKKESFDKYEKYESRVEVKEIKEEKLSNNHQFFKTKTNNTTILKTDEFNDYECAVIKYTWYISTEIPTPKELSEIQEFKNNQELINKQLKYKNKNGNFYIDYEEILCIEKLFKNQQFWNNIYQELKFLNIDIFNKLPNLADISQQIASIFKVGVESLPNLTENEMTIQYLNKLGNSYERIYDMNENIIKEFMILILNNVKEWFGANFKIETMLIWENFINKIVSLIFKKDEEVVDHQNHFDELNTVNQTTNTLNGSNIDLGNITNTGGNGMMNGGGRIEKRDTIIEKNYLKEFEKLSIDYNEEFAQPVIPRRGSVKSIESPVKKKKLFKFGW